VACNVAKEAAGNVPAEVRFFKLCEAATKTCRVNLS